jgi:hypothetical protein
MCRGWFWQHKSLRTPGLSTNSTVKWTSEENVPLTERHFSSTYGKCDTNHFSKVRRINCEDAFYRKSWSSDKHLCFVFWDIPNSNLKPDDRITWFISNSVTTSSFHILSGSFSLSAIWSGLLTSLNKSNSLIYQIFTYDNYKKDYM